MKKKFAVDLEQPLRILILSMIRKAYPLVKGKDKQRVRERTKRERQR